MQGNQTGYVHLSYSGDTLIEGEAAQRLNATVAGYDQTAGMPYFFEWAPFFTKDNVGVVSYWDEDQWRLLFDLNQPPGGGWLLEGYGFADRTVTVTDTGRINVDGVMLKYAEVELFPALPGDVVVDTVFERAGYASLFIRPVRTLGLEADIPYLRCYTDSAVTFENAILPSCNYVMGLDNFEHGDSFDIYYEPAHGCLIIDDVNGLTRSLTVHDHMGRAILRQSLTGQSTVQTNVLVTGLYLCILYDASGQAVASTRFFKH